MKEILLLLCQFPFNEENRDALAKRLREVTDWNKLIDLINMHGITALAAYNIKEAGLANEIPESAWAILENGLRKNVVRNIWLKERWKEINQILCNAEIKHILLKGMALEYSVYGAMGLRQMSDNDILIKPQDAERAWQLLQQSGLMAKTVKSPLYINILPYIGKHFPVLIKDGYAVEIHTRLFDEEIDGDLNYDKLFEEAIEITVDNNQTFILPEQIHLKYLKSHFAKHVIAGECQLRSYADLLILDKEMDYDFPDRFVPNPFQSDIRTFQKAAYKSNVYSVPAKYRLRFIMGDIFPSREWMKERYGCNGLKIFFYYPVRIGKLFWLL